MPPTNADYAKINIACKALGIDKSQLISDRYKLDTSKRLTRFQLEDLYKHFRALGWKPTRGKEKKKTSPIYADSQKRKIVALWITLFREGVVKNRSDKALQAYVKRMTKKDNLKWCDSGDCYRLIEGLKSWAKREDVDVE